MGDQVLVFHRVSPRVYDLTGLRTGSVRDQLIRSSLLAHSLVDEQLISKHAKLLVFGGGPAGINAALTAAEEGVSVDVIETKPSPFTTLLSAARRRVDPFEYDWPHDHFKAGTFPQNGRWIPLMQPSGTGADLARGWGADLTNWMNHRNGVAGRGTVEIFHSANAFAFRPISDNISSHINVTGPWPSQGTLSTRLYGAVLSCVGFSGEQTGEDGTARSWNSYRGPKFWTDDDGMPDGNAAAFSIGPIVISGGGDGAMQDFQRAATGEFGKDLLHKLEQLAKGWRSTADLSPDWLVRELLSAEDKGRRSYAWQRQKQGNPNDAQEWHCAFDVAVDKLFRELDQTNGSGIFMNLAKIFRPCLKSGHTAIVWMYKESTPGYAYALNRFLSLFLDRLAQHVSSHTAWRHLSLESLPNTRILRIKPTDGHVCASPATCLGMPHDVEFSPIHTTKSRTVSSKLIIIRHGAVPNPLLAKAAVREQMTPFDLPH